jgi:NAD(P)H-dependent FMN reductase
MKHILIFPASQRHDSLNRKLAVWLAQHLIGNVSIDVLESNSVDFPLFNQDLENVSEIIRRIVPVYNRFNAADAVVVVSPEYNGSVSPYLKNTVDWVSRLSRIDPDKYFNPFQEKPLMLASATAGASGGILGLQAARQIFSYLGSVVLAEQLCMPRANAAWDSENNPREPEFTEWAYHAMNRLLTLTGPSLMSDESFELALASNF